MKRSVRAGALLSGLLLSAGLAVAQSGAPGGGAGKGWEQRAEQTFCLGKGSGRTLMTEKEWQEHRAKMQSFSQEERARYRAEWHAKMMERAKEKGIELPAGPCPRGRAGGGPGGSGPGAGAGGARRGSGGGGS